MPDIPERKVGVIACSGEEIPEGTVSRLAALKVLEELRPGRTVTICLPLFLAGGQSDRAFAKFHPTLTIDGCEKRCAARSTERYSNKPAASIVISDLVREAGLDAPAGRRRLDDAGKQAVEITAQHAAALVDEILEQHWSRSRGSFEGKAETPAAPVQATCACGSGIPVQDVFVDGKSITLVGLPLMLESFAGQHEPVNEVTALALLEMAKIYNELSQVDEDRLCNVLLQEYAAYLRKNA